MDLPIRRIRGYIFEVSDDTEKQIVFGIDHSGLDRHVPAGQRLRPLVSRVRETAWRDATARDQAAHNALFRLGKRKEAWRKQHSHTVANEVVAEAVENDCNVIVFEDATDIRGRLPQAKWHHIWTFRRLYEFVGYKTSEHDSPSNRLRRTTCPNAILGRTVDPRTKPTATADTSMPEVRLQGQRRLQRGEEYWATLRPKATPQIRSLPKSGSRDAPIDLRVNGGTLNGKGHQPIAGDRLPGVQIKAHPQGASGASAIEQGGVVYTVRGGVSDYTFVLGTNQRIKGESLIFDRYTNLSNLISDPLPLSQIARNIRHLSIVPTKSIVVRCCSIDECPDFTRIVYRLK